MTLPAAPSADDPTGQIALNASQDVLAADGSLRETIMLIPYGEPLEGRDGRRYVFRDKTHAERVIAATNAYQRGADLFIDYDHQAHLSAIAGVGGRAPAAGWIKPDALSAGDDGLYGAVDWTGPARNALQSREYRYLSPAFAFDKKTGDVTRLINVGLTNKPNLEIPALASQGAGTPQEEENGMKTIALATLASALALNADAGEDDVLGAITSLKERADQAAAANAALGNTATALGLNADAGGDQVVAAALQAAVPDPEKYVPKGGYDEVAAELASIKEGQLVAQVDGAVAGGKLPPAMKDWALDLGRKDATALNSFLEKAPVFAGGATVEGDPPGADKSKLSDGEKAICSQLGVDEEAFLTARNKAEEVA